MTNLFKKFKQTKLGKKVNNLFLITTIIPTFFAIIYFGFMASNVYISESSFIVRSPQNNSLGFGSMLSNIGFSRSQDDNYSVNAYLRSRTALHELEEQLPLKQFYSDQGDYFSRYDPLFLKKSNELFYQYFEKQLNISLDRTSGITVLRVKAFNVEEAKEINSLLLKQGEAFINQLNDRAKNDTLTFAQQSVVEAEQHVADAALALRQYRIHNQIFDVAEQSQEKMAFISKLQGQLSEKQTQLAQLLSTSPQNPRIATLKINIQTLNQEIAHQTQKVLGRDQNSIANKSAEYQRLQLDSQFAIKELEATIAALHSAKTQLTKQRLYLEVIAKPSEPDFAEEPHRLYNIIATFFIGLILFGIFTLISASIREHKN